MKSIRGAVRLIRPLGNRLLCDGKNLDLAIAQNDDIADSLADERARHRGDVGDRLVSRICFVFTHNSENLAPAVVATERNAISKSNGVAQRRRRDELSAPQTLGKIPQIPISGRSSASALVHVLNLLRSVVGGTSYCHRRAQRS